MMDIISLPIEVNPDIYDSRFRLVAVAAQRARAMMVEGDDTGSGLKVTTRALLEAIDGKVKFLIGEEALAAMESEKEKARKKMNASLIFNVTDDIAKEARKDLDNYLKTSEPIPEKPAKTKLSVVDEIDEVEK